MYCFLFWTRNEESKLQPTGPTEWNIFKFGAFFALWGKVTIDKWREVVVAQVVERWHSVWAGQVRIMGQTKAFFSSELIDCYLAKYQEKGKINPKRGWERHICKNLLTNANETSLTWWISLGFFNGHLLKRYWDWNPWPHDWLSQCWKIKDNNCNERLLAR